MLDRITIQLTAPATVSGPHTKDGRQVCFQIANDMEQSVEILLSRKDAMTVAWTMIRELEFEANP